MLSTVNMLSIFVYLFISSHLEVINVEVRPQRNYWQRKETDSYKITLASMAKFICDLAFLMLTVKNL
jgi:hypothetical protein